MTYQEGSVTGNITAPLPVSGIIASKIAVSGYAGRGTKNIRELSFLPFSEFPEVGAQHILYIDTSSDTIYYWDGAMYRSVGSSSDHEIVAKSTDEWNAVPSYQSKRGGIYIYTDYRQEDGFDIPAVKIGDGNAYVMDLPFFDTGVTQSDREFWNNKVSAKISSADYEELVLYTNKEE